jgi:hypothetical protein
MYVTSAALQGLLSSAEINNADLSELPPVNFTALTDGDDPTPLEIAGQDIALTGQRSPIILSMRSL